MNAKYKDTYIVFRHIDADKVYTKVDLWTGVQVLLFTQLCISTTPDIPPAKCETLIYHAKISKSYFYKLLDYPWPVGSN